MISIGILLTIACGIVGASDTLDNNLTITNINENVTRILTALQDVNTTLDHEDLELLNRTLANIVDHNIAERSNDVSHNVTIPAKILSEHIEKIRKKPSYNAYAGEGTTDSTINRIVEESPDYASSVVLASDLLSLTSAVASVKEPVCRQQGYQFLEGLLMNKRWALKMFDASAKSPQGLLVGSSYHLGNFDECIDIKDPGDNSAAVQGQYCLATIQWKKENKSQEVRTGRGEVLRWAVCVPSGCDANAVQDFVNNILFYTVGDSSGVKVTERDCYMKRPLSVTSLDIGYLSFMLLFTAIIIFSTLYEIYTIYCGKNKQSTTHDVIISFSAVNNMKKIISPKQQTSHGLECIAGIKALAMIFILAGHACLFIASGPVMDAESWDRLLKGPENGFMLNNSILVDTFLLLSAFLFSRLLLIELDKRKGKLNVIPILVFRYIRVTPAYIIVILFYMTWLPKINQGPLWDDRLLLEQERCMASWWANILYVNNYVNTDKICMFQSWYLSVDTQLFFIAPIFIYSLWRWRKLGPIILSLAIIVSLVIPAVITYKENLDPTLLVFAKEFTDIVSNFYFKEAYVKTHMKMLTYFIGLLIGYLLHRIQSGNYQFSKVLKIFGWIICIILGTVTTFSISLFYQDWYQYNNIEAAAYISLHKVAWGIANGWLIIACATGNGGFVYKLLTWKLFVPFSRLTFCSYLVNGIVELYYVGQLRHPAHITFYTVMSTSISHVMLTFFIGLLLCISFESPIHGIEKVLLRKFVPAISDNVRRNESVESSRKTSQSKLDS